MEWYLKVLNQYSDFEGRARRKEFWMFGLIHFLIIMALQALTFLASPESTIGLALTGLMGIYSLGVLLPSLGVSVRRLHDTGRSGWWILIGFIPVIGFFVLLYFYVQDSQAGSNEYGENPKSGATATI